MNLFHNPSLTELGALIANSANYYNIYDILVEHDGEVLVELSFSRPTIVINKYKFYFRGLQGKTEIGILAAKNIKYLKCLYKNLMYCWENNLTGSIDYYEISSLQTINRWLQMNKISLSSDREKQSPKKH